MGRPGQKMIGIYVDEELYKEIRQAARMRGQTIKEFLIGLYNRSKEGQEQLNLLRQIDTKLDLLVGSNAVMQGSSMDFITPTSIRKNYPVKNNISANPVTKAKNSMMGDLSKFSEYLESIPHPRQKISIQETLRVILSLGGQATSSQIKDARGFTRSTAADRQIQKLVQDGILIKDTSVRPYVVRIAPSVFQ